MGQCLRFSISEGEINGNGTAKRISERALKVWRIYGIIYSVFFFLLAGGVIGFTIAFNWPVWMSVVSILLFVYQYIFLSCFFRRCAGDVGGMRFASKKLNLA